jgi:hypothetical protein
MTQPFIGELFIEIITRNNGIFITCLNRSNKNHTEHKKKLSWFFTHFHLVSFVFEPYAQNSLAHHLLHCHPIFPQLLRLWSNTFSIHSSMKHEDWRDFIRLRLIPFIQLLLKINIQRIKISCQIPWRVIFLF